MNKRLLSSDDWQKLRDIRLSALKTDPQAFGGNFDEEVNRQEPEWRKRLENSERFSVAIEENNALVSLAGAIKNKEDGKWMLVAVYTRPEARGRGYSQELTQFVIEEVKKRGASEIKLTVNVDQKDAVHVYEKAGFKIIETKKGEKMGDGKLHDEYLMVKKLI